MQQSIFQEIINFFTRGTVLARLIGINVAIFILINLIRVIFFLWNMDGAGDAMTHWLGVSSNVHVVLHRPWTLFHIHVSAPGVLSYPVQHDRIVCRRPAFQ